MEGSIQIIMNALIPFQTTDWKSLSESSHPGISGYASWKVINAGGVRMRLVKYSANYKADHWCSRGHIVYCLEGELISELSDGRMFSLSAGMSYQVSDGASQHRSSTTNGAVLLIIDGNFLSHKRELTLNPWKI